MNRPRPVVPVIHRTADALNTECYCRTLDPELLRRALEGDPHLGHLTENPLLTRPHLFSSTVVFLSQAVFATMEATVAAIERVVRLPEYEHAALHRAPAIASHAFGPRGVFMSYDFHVSPSGPRLIEINTNAGGALLSAALAGAQLSCCESMDWVFASRPEPGNAEQKFVDMFRREWQLQGREGAIGSVAIVDDDPSEQYLAPEFELCRRMFERFGIEALVVDAVDLQWRDERLWSGNQPIDMVYNRLTDFYLDDERHRALREAYETGTVVLSPNPRNHALHADKRNLVVLSDRDALARFGAAPEDMATLAAVVPESKIVSAENAQSLWDDRRHLFFKPMTGYGGKAAYRGDKLTRRVWAEILAGKYVAQTLVPPAERLIDVDGVLTDLKFDVRAYTYDGSLQLLAARMYAGQTTNFRTPGGGFAPVLVVA